MVVDVGRSDCEGRRCGGRGVVAGVLADIAFVSVSCRGDDEHAGLDQGIDGRVEDLGVTGPEGEVDDITVVGRAGVLFDDPVESSQDLGEGRSALLIETLDSD